MALKAEVVGSSDLVDAGVEGLVGLDRIASTPWETPEWMLAAASAYRAWSPRAVLVRDGDSIRAAVLLGTPQTSSMAPLRVVPDLELCEPTDIPADSAEAALLLSRSMLALGRPLLLSRVSPTSPLAEALLSQGGRRGLIRTRPALGTPVCHLDRSPPGSAGEYNNKWRIKTRRRAERTGRVDVSFESPSVDGTQDALDTFLQLEGAGWKGRDGTAVACRPEMEAFYRSYVTAATRSGSVRVTTLRIGGDVAAIQLSVVVGNRLCGLKVARDERFDQCQPGHVLMREMLLSAHAEGLASYEHNGIPEYWEERWSNGSRDYVEIRAYPMAPFGALALATDGAHSLQSRARRALRDALSGSGDEASAASTAS